jgi:hypothetical protein
VVEAAAAFATARARAARRPQRTAIERDGIEVDGVERDGIEVDGVERDGIEVDGIERDGIEVDGVERDWVIEATALWRRGRVPVSSDRW